MPSKEKIIILFIGFISIAVLLKAAMAAEMAMPEIPPGASKQETPQGTGKQSAPQSQAAGKIEYRAEGLRDPFEEDELEIKEEGPAKPLPPLQVTGIVWGGSLPQAIINNKVMKVGDIIDEARIIDIKNNSVTVFFDNRKYNLTTTLPLQKQDSKGNLGSTNNNS